MAPQSSTQSGPVFTTWALLLIAAVVAGIFGNLGLARYVEAQRAGDPRTYLRAAQQLMDQRDVLGAFAQLDEAARRAPTSPEPYRLRGHFHFQLKHWQEAFNAYQQAIDRGSRDEDMRLKAMNALMQMGRHEDAILFGKQCLAEGYTYRTFPRYIAESYRALAKPAESIAFYESALRGYPNDLFLMEHLAEAYRLVGQQDQADQMQARIAETQALYDRLTQ
jgi:tetratricopeptide (TPR) repeat protein